MLIPNNCSHCGRQLEPKERGYYDVEVSVESVGSGDYFHTVLLCKSCYHNMIDEIRKYAEAQE
jgi:hypothetical protein